MGLRKLLELALLIHRSGQLHESNLCTFRMVPLGATGNLKKSFSKPFHAETAPKKSFLEAFHGGIALKKSLKNEAFHKPIETRFAIQREWMRLRVATPLRKAL